MFSEYILSLYKQYCECNGKIPNIKELYELPNEFIAWLDTRQHLGKQYGEYISYLGIDSASMSIAEVGKGAYDTIFTEGMIIISPYAKTISKTQEPSSLIMLGNQPLIATKKNIIEPTCIDMFLTHNPHNEQLISHWHKIHNGNSHNICVGVYGKLYDKDRMEKIRMLERLSDKLEDDIEITYDEINDSYFYNIKSSRKILKKELIR